MGGVALLGVIRQLNSRACDNHHMALVIDGFEKKNNGATVIIIIIVIQLPTDHWRFRTVFVVCQVGTGVCPRVCHLRSFLSQVSDPPSDEEKDKVC